MEMLSPPFDSLRLATYFTALMDLLRPASAGGTTVLPRSAATAAPRASSPPLRRTSPRGRHHPGGLERRLVAANGPGRLGQFPQVRTPRQTDLRQVDLLGQHGLDLGQARPSLLLWFEDGTRRSPSSSRPVPRRWLWPAPRCRRPHPSRPAPNPWRPGRNRSRRGPSP